MMTQPFKIPDTMEAMVFEAPHKPLVAARIPTPQPNENQVLLKVEACGVCRTDLHIIDGELPAGKIPCARS